MKILVYSPQEQLLEKTTLELDKAGHEVTSVLQDHAAVEHLEKTQFDLVIIDLDAESTSKMMVKDLVSQLQNDCEIVDGHLDTEITAQLPQQT